MEDKAVVTPTAPSVTPPTSAAPIPPTATPSVVPPVPPVPPAPTQKTNTGLILAIVLLIVVLLGIGGYYYYANYYNKKTAPVYTPTPTTYTEASPTPQKSASPSGSPTANGIITGTICYPSSGIPAGKIVAKSTTTNEETSFDNPLNMASFSAALTPGTYKLKYVPTGGGVTGYYTSCTGNEPACQNNTTKRVAIPVTVSAGETASGIKICDYYYLQGLEPDF